MIGNELQLDRNSAADGPVIEMMPRHEAQMRRAALHQIDNALSEAFLGNTYGPEKINTRNLSLLTFFALLLILFFFGFSSLGLLLSLAAAVLLQLILVSEEWKKKAGLQGTSWIEHLYSLIAEYSPINTEAYKALQAQTSMTGVVDKVAIRTWIHAETEAIVLRCEKVIRPGSAAEVFLKKSLEQSS
jgi:hypothetical protein